MLPDIIRSQQNPRACRNTPTACAEAADKIALNDIAPRTGLAGRMTSQVNPAAQHARLFQCIIARPITNLSRAMVPIDVDELIFDDPVILPDQEDPSITESLNHVVADQNPARLPFRKRVPENDS